MQVRERGQHLEHVRDRLFDGQRIGAARLRAPLLQHCLQRGPADVLHHGVAGVLVLHEVEDLHDRRVLD